jgi:hypothetical protein
MSGVNFTSEDLAFSFGTEAEEAIDAGKLDEAIPYALLAIHQELRRIAEGLERREEES